jgi:hypothetical protein
MALSHPEDQRFLLGRRAATRHEAMDVELRTRLAVQHRKSYRVKSRSQKKQ